MISPAELTRRVSTLTRQRDPEGDGLRQALRAAIFIPISAALGFAVGAGTQTPVFALIGAIALLIVTDFPGRVPTRALAYLTLAVGGAILITIATLAAPHHWVVIPLAVGVGALAVLSGLLSDVAAAGQRAALVMFILPVCVRPTGPLGDRLFGWFIALVICVPAALWVFAPRYHSDLRRQSTGVCTALADRLEGTGSAEKLAEAMDGLQKAFLANAFRPVALTDSSRMLIRVVPNLQWLCDRVDDHTARLLGPMADSAVRVLRDCAEALSGADRSGTVLTRTAQEHRGIALRRYKQDIADILGEQDDPAAIDLGFRLLNRRTMSATIGLIGRNVGHAAAADARPFWAKLLGRRLPETGVADRLPSRGSTLTVLGGYLRTRSITVINSLRTGLAVAVAVGITFAFPVQNAPWVVLGTLSVLRSSAVTTRSNAIRAVAGTLIGITVGAAVIAVLGVDRPVLWSLLPVVAFGSTYISRVGSFTASQAMFTIMVLIVFNLIEPAGWRIGIIRIEDVMVGALVGVAVSLLLWPRAGAVAVQRAIDGALRAGSRYLAATVYRVTRGASEQSNDAIIALHRETLVAVRTYGDAVHDYLTENAGAIDSALLDTTSQIPRVRTAGDLIADIVPPPLGVYPRARRVLEAHTAAVCARLDGGEPDIALPPIGEEFIPALRSEARPGELAAAAALPLVIAAASVGELELLYPLTDYAPVC